MAKQDLPPNSLRPSNAAFGFLLRTFLLLPAFLAIAAWLAQWLMQFPPRSLGIVLTAVGFMLSLIAGIVPVAVALRRFVRSPLSRTPGNIAFVVIACMPVALGVVFIIALAVR